MTLWHHPTYLRILSSWLMLAAVLVLLLSAAVWVTRLPFFQISRIDVRPIAGHFQQIDRAVIKTVRLGALKGGLLRADLQSVKREFEKAPWVRKASVRRVWPNRLLVELEEHQAVALWSDGRLVNSHHELFNANSAALENEDSLPALTGPDGSHSEVAKRWREMNEWLKPANLQVVDLTLSDRYAWQVQLSNGSVLLLGKDHAIQTGVIPAGQTQSEQGSPQLIKERVQRFVHALPELTQRLGSMPEHFDLRHTEGFAIKPPAVRKVATTDEGSVSSGAQAKTVPPTSSGSKKNEQSKPARTL